MPTITVRVDDATRDSLLEKAEEEGVNLSDLVRDLLMEAVVPVRDDVAARGDLAPDSLSARDRQMFTLLHRILARVLPEDANGEDGDLEYQLDRALTLEAGYTLEYGSAFAGIQQELSRRDCTRVMDILDMFRILDFSVERHAKEGSPIDADVVADLRYLGFDFNDSLEGHMASYVQYLVDHGRWQERRESIAANDGGNSHMQTLDLYMRMLAEYRRIGDVRRRGHDWDHFLSAEELQAIADATVHPSRRGRK
ncbi:ribbon-helix-helix protein, CopG family [Cryobacterium melibiosiphilum]|uniref:Ribbon-helix-helix protein, CopG family n=1 Tax=Cryobacterium melibiosiphilum TaxID=995039 RepID=A0A3A5MWQ0_9MICO|nr:YfbU family protein [Cryobacterium melibiosiphilum]RJT91658.1 ribbon-helix-helix protein, CopG family [Cryobacterium melibiosiphilum]